MKLYLLSHAVFIYTFWGSIATGWWYSDTHLEAALITFACMFFLMCLSLWGMFANYKRAVVTSCIVLKTKHPELEGEVLKKKAVWRVVWHAWVATLGPLVVIALLLWIFSKISDSMGPLDERHY